ncbi:MAG: hypothetical protein LBL59_02575 [Xanthomonadaceae bacterium]|nr:hypothetical protein [Xanthomonadaceae bacterium]
MVAITSVVDGAPQTIFLARVLAVTMAGIGCGVYGIYSAMDGPGWGAFINVPLMGLALVPCLRLIVLVIIAIKGRSAMKAAGYGYSLLGKIVKSGQ